MEVNHEYEEYFKTEVFYNDSENDETDYWLSVETSFDKCKNPEIIEKKKIYSYGKAKLNDIRARFEKTKIKLYNIKQRQLDEELKEINNATHHNSILISDKLNDLCKIELDRLSLLNNYSLEFEHTHLAAMKRSINNTFTANKCKVRQSLISSCMQRLFDLETSFRASLNPVHAQLPISTNPLSLISPTQTSIYSDQPLPLLDSIGSIRKSRSTDPESLRSKKKLKSNSSDTTYANGLIYDNSISLKCLNDLSIDSDINQIKLSSQPTIVKSPLPQSNYSLNNTDLDIKSSDDNFCPQNNTDTHAPFATNDFSQNDDILTSSPQIPLKSISMAAYALSNQIDFSDKNPFPKQQAKLDIAAPKSTNHITPTANKPLPNIKPSYPTPDIIMASDSLIPNTNNTPSLPLNAQFSKFKPLPTTNNSLEFPRIPDNTNNNIQTSNNYDNRINPKNPISSSSSSSANSSFTKLKFRNNINIRPSSEKISQSSNFASNLLSNSPKNSTIPLSELNPIGYNAPMSNNLNNSNFTPMQTFPPSYKKDLTIPPPEPIVPIAYNNHPQPAAKFKILSDTPLEFLAPNADIKAPYSPKKVDNNSQTNSNTSTYIPEYFPSRLHSEKCSITPQKTAPKIPMSTMSTSNTSSSWNNNDFSTKNRKISFVSPDKLNREHFLPPAGNLNPHTNKLPSLVRPINNSKMGIDQIDYLPVATDTKYDTQSFNGNDTIQNKHIRADNDRKNYNENKIDPQIYSGQSNAVEDKNEINTSSRMHFDYSNDSNIVSKNSNEPSAHPAYNSGPLNNRDNFGIPKNINADTYEPRIHATNSNEFGNYKEQTSEIITPIDIRNNSRTVKNAKYSRNTSITAESTNFYDKPNDHYNSISNDVPRSYSESNDKFSLEPATKLYKGDTNSFRDRSVDNINPMAQKRHQYSQNMKFENKNMINQYSQRNSYQNDMRTLPTQKSHFERDFDTKSRLSDKLTSAYQDYPAKTNVFNGNVENPVSYNVSEYGYSENASKRPTPPVTTQTPILNPIKFSKAPSISNITLPPINSMDINYKFSQSPKTRIPAISDTIYENQNDYRIHDGSKGFIPPIKQPSVPLVIESSGDYDKKKPRLQSNDISGIPRNKHQSRRKISSYDDYTPVEQRAPLIKDHDISDYPVYNKSNSPLPNKHNSQIQNNTRSQIDSRADNSHVSGNRQNAQFHQPQENFYHRQHYNNQIQNEHQTRNQTQHHNQSQSQSQNRNLPQSQNQNQKKSRALFNDNMDRGSKFSQSQNDAFSQKIISSGHTKGDVVAPNLFNQNSLTNQTLQPNSQSKRRVDYDHTYESNKFYAPETNVLPPISLINISNHQPEDSKIQRNKYHNSNSDYFYS
ncbi:hypothetical protein AYI69_g103 [Smittium culicis]|uniref:Uncharacterized protein n=1 Tax=Smittium culicis TaxID=133412 RepID=A0A1R1YTY8_9FUNG|nr:hypothetical protein AYI69_g103 [Smittium culicis]